MIFVCENSDFFIFFFGGFNLKLKHSSDLVNLIKLSSNFFPLTLSSLTIRIRAHDLSEKMCLSFSKEY